MKKLIVAVFLGFFGTTAMAAAPNDKGLVCADQSLADQSGEIDTIISDQFIAFWFADDTALKSQWRRQNDIITIRSSPAGSRYATNSKTIEWTTRALVDGKTVEDRFSVDRQSLELSLARPSKSQKFTCELVDQSRAYDAMLEQTRQTLQNLYDKELAANKL